VLRRLSLRDFVIVAALDVDFGAGFTVLTGETGAGKSILVDALQLALGSRGDSGAVREGAPRAEIGAEFDAPPSLEAWLGAAGFEPGPDDDAERLLLRRTIDAQGKSRAWINGRAATIAQLREASDHLVDIHGQHAWQSLARGPAVRALLDDYAGVDTAALASAWSTWKRATEALTAAGTQQAGIERERERLAWQIGEVARLAPAEGEWSELEAEHRRLANAQSLIDAARGALAAISDTDAGRGAESAEASTARALQALQDVAAFDAALASTIEVLESAQAQLQDAAHTLGSYLNHTETEPDRLQTLDDRLSAWIGMARRYRRPPEALPALLAQWTDELRTLDAAADIDALQAAVASARSAYDTQAARISALRAKAAPRLGSAVTQALQQLGMGGGVFDVALAQQDVPQSFGFESAEFLVAGHAGSTPRPLAKVASGGELSRIALAVAVTTSQQQSSRSAHPAGQPAVDADGATAMPATLIFDEIDAGVGGAVAETVGRLMKQLGCDRQVLAVTHLPQVAACADHHFVVSKRVVDGATLSDVRPVTGEVRVAEVARMLGGERLSNTRLAHAEEMLAVAAAPPADAPANDAADMPADGRADTSPRNPRRARRT
jgi:DNA repair protein RecN (Recombination protein N)